MTTLLPEAPTEILLCRQVCRVARRRRSAKVKKRVKKGQAGQSGPSFGAPRSTAAECRTQQHEPGTALPRRITAVKGKVLHQQLGFGGGEPNHSEYTYAPHSESFQVFKKETFIVPSCLLVPTSANGLQRAVNEARSDGCNWRQGLVTAGHEPPLCGRPRGTCVRKCASSTACVTGYLTHVICIRYPDRQTPTLLPLGLARTGGDRELKAVELHVRVVLGVVVAAGDRRAALTDRRF